jgi:carbamoyl-phosphate synthase large subunit
VPKHNDIKKILIIGSGPIVIGQACEFDYSGTQACKALRKLGYEIVLVNSNPATIMTDPGMADVTYIEPLDVGSLEKIIASERPHALLPNVGGQTALNLTYQLAKDAILAKYGVRIIGINQDIIEMTENRQVFKNVMKQLGMEVPKSEIARSLEEAESVLERINLPCAIRPAYTIGGAGGGLVYNLEEFRTVANRGLSASPAGQLLIEESVEGWEELELEVVRDAKGQKITVCFIENVDAMGVHTGDSFCVAPMLTISPEIQQKLQDYAYAIMDAVGIIGGTNLQFAHDPNTGRIVVIEINPRMSRSSALASKATGLPVAYVSTLLAGGLSLDEIPYWRERSLDKYTPQSDSVVIKLARWAFEKFKGAEDRLGTQMRAIGEVLGVGRNYKEAFQKSIRSLEIGRLGLGFAKDFNKKSLSDLMSMLWYPTSERQFIMYEALRKGATIDELHRRTFIKPYFIRQMKELVGLEEEILKHRNSVPPNALLIQAKKYGFADGYLAKLLDISEEKIRSRRLELGLVEGWESIAVSGVENASYHYSTYSAHPQTMASRAKKVMILGGGPNRIGQGIEFDYCCVHAAFALRDLGYETVMVNCNPETVSTDYDTSDKLYLEPLTMEDVLGICRKENPEGVIVQFGGQTPMKICEELERAGIAVLGTPSAAFDLTRDQDRFRRLMKKLGIPQPASDKASNIEEAMDIASRIGYPLIVRPVHSAANRKVEVAHDQEDLALCVSRALEARPRLPVFIERFLENAMEAEVDAISDGKDAFIPSIMEHIELAGIHSGDSACVLPPVSIAEKHRKTIEEYTKKIAVGLNVLGLINIQFAIADDTVYILEANPRASRTVPLVSKVCNIQMVRMATQLMLGGSLRDLHLVKSSIPHFGVKEAVFPFDMFHEVDPVLGPEMRSTGEVLGMAGSFGLAFHKAEEAANQMLPQQGTVLISVSDSEKKEALDVVREFATLGFKLKATEGTQQYLSNSGIECETILKMSAGRPNIADAIKNGEIQLVINTPIGKRSTTDDSYIRKTAIKHKIPYVTTMAAARAAAKGIAAYREKEVEVVSLQRYHAAINQLKID